MTQPASPNVRLLAALAVGSMLVPLVLFIMANRSDPGPTPDPLADTDDAGPSGPPVVRSYQDTILALDPAVVDAFLVDHYGSHGVAPEADISPFPEGMLTLAMAPAERGTR